MEHRASEAPLPETPQPQAAQRESASDGLLDRLSLIESQPLEQRALGFEQLHDELLAELQRSDHEST